MNGYFKKRTIAVVASSSEYLRSKYAGLALGIFAFAESAFLPVVIDPLLAAMILVKPEKWRRYTIIAILASVLGGVFGYLLGTLFFDTLGVRLVAFYSLESVFASVSDNLNQNGFVFVLIGALTPVPYKLVAIASGLLHLNIFTFIIASLVGRCLRLGVVGLITYYAGPQTLAIVRKNLYQISLFIAVILSAYLLIKFFI